MVIAIGLVVLSLVWRKASPSGLLAGLMIVILGKAGFKVDWVILAQQIERTIVPGGTTLSVTPPKVVSPLPQGDGVLTPVSTARCNAWQHRVLSTADEAIALAENMPERYVSGIRLVTSSPWSMFVLIITNG